MTVTDAYFSAEDHPYWQWQDEGNVVAWSDGSTIAFRAELLTVFQRLRTQGLPPFGAVLLLLAACRDGWSETPSKLGLLGGVLSAGKRNDRLELLNRTGAGLDRVRALNSTLRYSSDAKAELAAMVFEGQGDPPLPSAYDAIIDALAHGLTEQRPSSQRRSPVDRLLRDLAWLDRGLDRVNESLLALRVKTGLEQLPAPVPVEVPVVKTSPGLLAELKDDPELGGVARLAKLLLAAVHMPRPLSSPEELSVGGVSDISNRGTLDRLLLSELANDGLTLAVRVAMNEALYLRRETPPRTPTRRRLVLLDSGLRMWGVPRVFATAVGLALSVGAEAGTEVVVYRAAGGELAPVDMTAAAGLTEHLAALDTHAHPGNCLPELLALTEAAGDEVDVILVTGDDVLADRHFQRALAEAEFPEVHLATVNRAGEFRFSLQTRRGRKLLRQAQFALDEVLKPPQKPTIKLLESGDEALPAIFRASPFPLRLSCPVDTERSWYVKDVGAFSYTRDGRLLHWISPDRGARQIAEHLPPGNLHWAATRSENGSHVIAVIGKLSSQGLRILEIDAGTGTCSTTRLELDVDQPKTVFVHGGVLFAADVMKIGAYGLASGKLLATRSLAGLKQVRGRFYRFDRSQVRLWKAISYDGSAIQLTELFRDAPQRQELLSVFESVSAEGPVGVLKSGHLFNLELNQERKLEFRNPPAFDSAEIAELSRDGARLILRSGASSPMLVDVRTLSCQTSYYPGALEPELFATAKLQTLRHRFHAVGIDTAGRLTLVGRRDGYWPLEYREREGGLHFPSQPQPTTLRVRYDFESFDAGRSDSYPLAKAEFADGSRVVLDGRGLLHLKSSDASLPELTIVIVEGVTSGWRSDGRWWGNPYFMDLDLPLSHIGRCDVLHDFLERLR